MVKINGQGIIFQNGFVSFLLLVRWICYHLKTATLVLTEYIGLRKKGTSGGRVLYCISTHRNN